MTISTFGPHTLALIPSAKCKASCKYCFGHGKGNIMSRKTFDATLKFIKMLPEHDNPRRIIFNGGEPLLAGNEWFEYALKKLSDTAPFSFSIQSNLWELNRDFINTFAKYNVSISTSIDGDREICDSQRGQGYFNRTMSGIRMLRDNGLEVSAIATITPMVIEQIPRIIKFFDNEELPFTLRGALPSMIRGYRNPDLYVSSNNMQQLFNQSLKYLEDKPSHHIRDVEEIVKSVLKGHSNLCTFENCTGQYLAISDDGGIYSCQRFCGIKEFCLADVHNINTANEITSSEAYRTISARYEASQQCNECSHKKYCNGGCVYSMITADKHNKPHPFCNEAERPAYFYRAMFDKIRSNLACEAAASMIGNDNGNTPYLYMAGDRRHPASEAQNIRILRRAGQWAKNGAPRYAFSGQSRRENVFLNITGNCPLRCTHCSVDAGEGFKDMPPDTVLKVIREAVEMGYKEISLNGGEPFAYQNFGLLIKNIGQIDRKRTRFALFTNLYMDFDNNMALLLLRVFDEITISIDGDCNEHDARRGQGSFNRTCANIRKLVAIAPSKCRISIRASLTLEQRDRGIVEKVYNAARELGVESVYIKPVFPIGRAKNISGIYSIRPTVINKKHPSNTLRLRNTCGIGRSLHITPEGNIYPCWAVINMMQPIGNISSGLGKATNEYLSENCKWWTVDYVEKCRNCNVRYLCGGICRAYLDTDCTALRNSFLEMEKQASVQVN
jgi:uncharacterized protein